MAEFEQGHKSKGGRPKGSKNKIKRDVHDKAEQLGVDPFEIILLFAKGDSDALGFNDNIRKPVDHKEDGTPIYPDRVEIPMDMRLNAAKEACTYLYSKKKAITLSGSIADLPHRSFAFPDPRKPKEGESNESRESTGTTEETGHESGKES